MRLSYSLITLLSFLFIACQSSSTDTPSHNEEDTPENVPAVAKDEEQPSSTSDSAGIEERLFDFLQDWRTAQNEGDFQKYASFYSKNFSGIKRVGPDKYEYDYEGWLNNRKRMFNNHMSVGTESIKIQYRSAPYKIIFDQSWKSGDFADFGPKILEVAMENDTLKIINEEMLESFVKNFTGEINNLIEHPDFFFRVGNHHDR